MEASLNGTRRMLAIPAAIGLLVACAGSSGGDPECSPLCRLLVQDCGFQAYPEFDSCIQGCAYDREQGSDITLLTECIQGAVPVDDGECDTFTIVECSNAYGPE